MFKKFCLSSLALSIVSIPAAMAQVPPDAGRILRQMPAPQSAPPDEVDIGVDSPAPAAPSATGGQKVTLNAVQFNGNTHVDEAALQKVVAGQVGQAVDMGQLQELAYEVTVFYRKQGYPFARAYLPAQRMEAGVLKIEVLEGNYGKVAATSEDPALAAAAQPFLAPLQTGEVIRGKSLERTVLIMSDLPGVTVRPVIRPGSEVGTGDLDVQATLSERFKGSVSYDNFGDRYSGRHRLLAQGAVNSPFMLGDQLTLSAMATNEKLYFGSIGYSMPLGTSGLRGDVGFAHSSYELGEGFEALGARGDAEVFQAGASYPILRSNQANLLFVAHFQRKNLTDKYTALDIDNKKASNSFPIGLQFDARDTVLGGGVTYGGVTFTAGELKLGSYEQVATDRLTARAEGSFSKFNLDLARLQVLPAGLTLFGRVQGQWSNSNLDSSERFSLGGANGVRAYPQGEAIGDEGLLAQFELRYDAGMFVPYAFYDVGRVRVNRQPWTADDNHRTLSGAGVGVRFQRSNVLVDGTVAWRGAGGDSQADPDKGQPQFWLRMAYQF